MDDERAGDGCVVTGRGMDDAAMQMQHCMNVRTTDGDGDGVDAADMMSMVVSPIENHAETPGFMPNVRFVRLGERALYAAVILPSADSAYAHADQLPVLMKPYGGPGFQQVVESQSFYWDAQWWADQATSWLPPTVAAPPAADRSGIARSTKHESRDA